MAKPTQKRDLLSSFPATLRQSTQYPNIIYTRAPGLYALQSPGRAGTRESAPVAAGTASTLKTPKALLSVTGDGGEIRVYKGAPVAGVSRTRESLSSDVLLAVYERAGADVSQGGAGGLAVPTGRVFVRFADAIKIETRADELRDLGYRITQMLSYAPNAGWLEAIDGADSALQNIVSVEKLRDVVNVEPQLLSPRESKSMP